MARSKELKPVIHLRFAAKKPEEAHAAEFGPGVAALCKEVHDGSSLYQAAKKQGMSYSNAWTLIKKVESAFGVQLLVRETTKSVKLTPEGERLVKRYFALQEKLEAEVARIYEEVKKIK